MSKVNRKKFLRKKIYAKNAFLFVGIAPETISELRILFPVAFNSLTFVKNLYEKIFTEKNFYAKKLSKFVGKVPETKLFSVKKIQISFCQTSYYWRLGKNVFAAQIWSPALYRWKIMHFHWKNFSVSIFFYSLLTIRQTIEGYGKMHSQLRYGLRHYTDEK